MGGKKPYVTSMMQAMNQQLLVPCSTKGLNIGELVPYGPAESGRLLQRRPFHSQLPREELVVLPFVEYEFESLGQ